MLVAPCVGTQSTFNFLSENSSGRSSLQTSRGWCLVHMFSLVVRVTSAVLPLPDFGVATNYFMRYVTKNKWCQYCKHWSNRDKLCTAHKIFLNSRCYRRLPSNRKINKGQKWPQWWRRILTMQLTNFLKKETIDFVLFTCYFQSC